MTRLILLFTFLCLGRAAGAQSLSGRITNEYDEPVPFANVYVKELGTGALSDDEGRYVFNFSVDGEYEIVYSSLGYTSRTINLVVGLEPRTYDVRLITSGVDLQEITVSASERDPAYAIIREAVARKGEYLRAISTYRTQVYVKAVEEIDDPRISSPPPAGEDRAPAFPAEDPFEDEADRNAALLAGLNMVEMQLWLNFAYPRSYKEERTAYRAYGDTRGLFVPNFAETDFNFYRNLVALPGIASAPVISPLSNTSVLTYKFSLESSDVADGQLVYRIRVTPRKAGNSTVDGLLFINAESYTINRLEFALPAGGLVFSDRFSLAQAYRRVQGDDWHVAEQRFRYATRRGKKKIFTGTTTLSYGDYAQDYVFPDKFFGNEVAVTTAAAYERDSTYWARGRTVALSEEERRMVYLRDSIETVTSSQAYQDSIEQLYNRVTLLDLAFDGVGFRNNRRKSHLYFGPVTSLVDFSPVGGWRVGPYASAYRRYPSGKMLNVKASADVGLKNLDVQGKLVAWFRYDPFQLGDVSLWVGRDFESFNPNDAYLNQLKASNFFVKEEIALGQQREIVNGLYLRTLIRAINRRSIADYDTESLIDGIVTDEEPTVAFDGYQALITQVGLTYTPGQRYLREPRRKVILGSNWPTFSLTHRRGWSGLLSSDVRFDYLEAAVEQDVSLGALGVTTYRAQVGRFVNTDALPFVDIKRFRDSDPLLFSDPLTTFQALDASLNTSGMHLELHHIHHFNGAIINNIPLLKKTRIRAVAGGGLLYLRDRDFRYQELFAGVERIFKLGARRRVRLGAYAVAADASDARPTTAYKVSFDLIDIWEKDWNF